MFHSIGSMSDIVDSVPPAPAGGDILPAPKGKTVANAQQELQRNDLQAILPGDAGRTEALLSLDGALPDQAGTTRTRS
jgi:hypothetical protein